MTKRKIFEGSQMWSDSRKAVCQASAYVVAPKFTWMVRVLVHRHFRAAASKVRMAMMIANLRSGDGTWRRCIKSFVGRDLWRGKILTRNNGSAYTLNYDPIHQLLRLKLWVYLLIALAFTHWEATRLIKMCRRLKKKSCRSASKLQSIRS